MKSANIKNIKLKKLSAIIFDCQATNANPEKGCLLEMAWDRTNLQPSADSINKAEKAYLIKLPDGAVIPRQVARVTGISKEDINSGVLAKLAWEELLKSAGEIKNHQNFSPYYMIIHYSRYEEPYLKHLHNLFSPSVAFPFKIICTHQISKKLWPELPRRGLRAVAGFLGYSVGEMRRSAHHVAATSWIWQKLVKILEEREGIVTIEDLQNWINKTPFPRIKKQYPMNKEKPINIPDLPGIYRMLRSNGDLLYIGKATSLKQRISSYFQRSSNHAEHILEMLSQAKDISITGTKTALEAALLESDEIKRLSPQYNVALKERNREICFADSNLNKISNNYSRKFRMGPVPSKDSLYALYSILDLLKDTNLEQVNDNIIIQSLMVPAEFIPDENCFLDGLKIFREEHASFLIKRFNIKKIIKLGTILWQDKLNRAEQEDIEHDDKQKDEQIVKEEQEVWEWTPERVAHKLNSVISYGVHLIRRGEWFRKISESSLIWDKKNSSCNNKNLIIISKAQIINSRNLLNKVKNPIPPNYKTSNIQRMKDFKLSDYDRMRVLTTEIRRLLKDNRNPVLSLGPKLIIKGEKLAEELKWV